MGDQLSTYIASAPKSERSQLDQPVPSHMPVFFQRALQLCNRWFKTKTTKHQAGALGDQLSTSLHQLHLH